MKKIFLILILLGFFVVSAQAEMIILRNGESYHGDILEKTSEYIVFDTGYGEPTKYYYGDLEIVGGQSVSTFFDDGREPAQFSPSLIKREKYSSNGMSVPDFGGITERNLGIFTAVSTGVSIIMFIIFYSFFTIPIYILAKKTDAPLPILAFVPILQMYTMIKIGGKSGFYFFLLLVPFVNIIIMVLVWMGICEERGRNPFLGLLGLIPLVNNLLLWWLALSDGGVTYEPVEEPKPEGNVNDVNPHGAYPESKPASMDIASQTLPESTDPNESGGAPPPPPPSEKTPTMPTLEDRKKDIQQPSEEPPQEPEKKDGGFNPDDYPPPV